MLPDCLFIILRRGSSVALNVDPECRLLSDPEVFWGDSIKCDFGGRRQEVQAQKEDLLVSLFPVFSVPGETQTGAFCFCLLF